MVTTNSVTRSFGAPGGTVPNDGRMARLLVNARAGQWSAAEEIDWGCGPRLPRWWPRKAFTAAVSQLYYGELATAAFCRRLMTWLDDPIAVECLRFQVADENRHAALYGDYLAGLGGPQPIQSALALAVRSLQNWQGPLEGLVLAYHLVLEGEALFLQDAFARRVPCPLFRQINQRVLRDEARHVAFGKILLRHRLPGLDRDARRAIYGWLRDLWWTVARAAVAESRLLGAMGGLRAGLGARWAEQEAGLLAAGLIDRADLAKLERPLLGRLAQ